MRYLVFCITLVACVSLSLAKKGKLKKVQNCNLPCPKDMKPVCGSDGITYSNKCEYKNAKCLANSNRKSLFIQYEGKCGDPKNINIRVKPLKKRKNKRRKPCPSTFSRCKKLNSTRNAVCGSDNKTYHTFCHFRIAKCRSTLAGKPLTLIYKGVCGKPRTRLVCPIVSQCPNRNSPICGGDGKTYRNLCFFLISKCEARKQKKRIRLQYRGTCGSPVTPKPCPAKCPTIYKPVCGSDGKTYQNGCEMAKVKCLLPKGMKRQLRVKYRGACGSPSTPKPCLTVRKCRRKRGTPVCGTDGITYQSKCHLRIVKCMAKRNKKRSPVALKHIGQCVNGN